MSTKSKSKARRKRKPTSPRERERIQRLKQQHREQRRESVPRVLYTREQTGAALGGISISSVIRLENEGKLRKVRLRGTTGQVFNPAQDVETLASVAEG